MVFNLISFNLSFVCREAAKDIRFEWKERPKEGGAEVSKGMVSVVEYFKRQYRINLKYPQLPCLELGNPNNVVKIPLEICSMVPHQRLRRTMTNAERSEMTRASGSQSPNQRLSICENFVKNQFHEGVMADKNRPFLTEFEINVDEKLLRIGAKVIPPPQLKYSSKTMNTQSVTPNRGEWEMHKSSSKFLRPAR